MATILSSAIDPQRAADIASNAAAMGEPAQMARYIVTIGTKHAARLSFEAMARSSCEACSQHVDLCEPGEKIDVQMVRGAA